MRPDDILAVADHYGLNQGDQNYLLLYDVDGNGLIRVSDILAVVGHYFETCPEPIDAEAMSAAVTAAEAMETYATDNNGSYAGATVAALTAIEPTLADLGSRLTLSGLSADTYTVSVVSDRDGGNVVFSITRSADGTATRTCTVAGGVERGACSESGSW